MSMQRFALVSKNYNITGLDGRWDYARYVQTINRIADEHNCDTVLYALYTWDISSGDHPDHDALFDSLLSVRHVVLETARLSRQIKDGEDMEVQIWTRGNPEPVRIKQIFSTSRDLRQAIGRTFISSLQHRRVENSVLLSCGESNIVQMTQRPHKGMVDPFEAVPIIHSLGSVILNPIHDYMTRYEMKEKRRYLSLSGHTVLSVWNQGKRKGEARVPWTVFCDGKEVSEQVTEIPHPIPDRPDIRIGIFDTPIRDVGRHALST